MSSNRNNEINENIINKFETNSLFEMAIENDAKILNLWPTAVVKKSLGRSLNFLEKTLINKNHKLTYLSNNYRTEDTNVLSDPSLFEIKEFILKSINIYRDTVLSPKNQIEFYITQSWLSFSNTGHNHHPHYHTNSILSGVFYLEVDSSSDSIDFYNNAYTFNNRGMIHFNNKPTWWTSKMISVPVSSGDVVIFPSYLDHGVHQINKLNHRRVSLAFNTWVKGDLGITEALNELRI